MKWLKGIGFSGSDSSMDDRNPTVQDAVTSLLPGSDSSMDDRNA